MPFFKSKNIDKEFTKPDNNSHERNEDFSKLPIFAKYPSFEDEFQKNIPPLKNVVLQKNDLNAFNKSINNESESNDIKCKSKAKKEKKIQYPPVENLEKKGKEKLIIMAPKRRQNNHRSLNDTIIKNNDDIDS